MKCIMKWLTLVTAILALAAPLALAQTAPPAAPAAPGTPAPADLQSARPSSPLGEAGEEIEGPVKKIDPASKTLQVGWFLGLFRTSLEVTDDTQITVDGMKASLQDIREGDEVKASYEPRDGKNLARSIEVTPAEGNGGSSRTQTPASPASPQ